MTSHTPQPAAPRQLRRSTALVALAALALGLGCDTGESTTPHPTDRLDFPVSVTADPSGSLVWVVSGNFDLGYRSAAVLAIDVDSSAFVPELAFEVGGFPGPFKLFEKDGKAVAGYITSRDQDRLYVANFGGTDPARPTVSCPGGEVKGGILHCPKDGSIDRTTVSTADGDFELTLGEDPWGIEVSPSQAPGEPDLLLVGAMGDGHLATLSLAADGTPTIIGAAGLASGLFGIVRNPVTGRIYTSSKLANVVTVLNIAKRLDAEHPEQTPDNEILDPVNPWISVAATVSIPEPSSTDRARALAISRDGTRLYAAYRAPDALVVLDIADSASGSERQRVLQKVPLDEDPNDLAVVPSPSGIGDFVYVSCFKADRVEVVDPASGEVVGGIHTGRGPGGMALVDKPGLKRLYVALFHSNAVGVIELDPTSPYYHTEIAEIR